VHLFLNTKYSFERKLFPD